jgi:hypothetical protein
MEMVLETDLRVGESEVGIVWWVGWVRWLNE